MNFTHEIKELLEAWESAVAEGGRCVLATVVDLDGSSYRKPGVRMLLTDTGKVVGAVSGGCVENKVKEVANKVFESGLACMMTYDGRFRLGCEGVLYLLLEPFNPSVEEVSLLKNAILQRKTFSIQSYYMRDIAKEGGMGSVISFGGKHFCVEASVSVSFLENSDCLIFTQVFEAMFQLVIFGAEYDAARLSRQASFLGWHVTVVASPFQQYSAADFPGVAELIQASPAQLPLLTIDEQTAVVLMTHNYAKDLAFYLAIQQLGQPCYIGLLGSTKRREKLLEDVMVQSMDFLEASVDVIHGPAGLDIGSETAEEIAMSICSEILAVQRNRDAGRLRTKKQSGVFSS